MIRHPIGMSFVFVTSIVLGSHPAAATPVSDDFPFQVRYAANLHIGYSIISIDEGVPSPDCLLKGASVCGLPEAR